MTTRRATSKDLHSIYSLVCEVAEQTFVPKKRKTRKIWEAQAREHIETMLQNGSDLFLVMQDGGRAIACGSGHVEKNTITLGHAFCRDQGHGYGRKVLGQLLAWAVNFPEKTLVCSVLPGSSTDRFLRSIGFTEAGEETDPLLGQTTTKLQADPQSAYWLFTRQQ